jgi:hypothetical protein
MLKLLKVLSRKMDLSGHWSLKSEARSFSEKIVCPQSCESRLKIRAPPCFMIGCMDRQHLHIRSHWLSAFSKA